MNSRVIASVVRGFLLALCLQLSLSTSWAADTCPQPVGKLVSIQGQAQLQRGGQSSWQSATMDIQFCPGDTLRVNNKGRAAVVLINESILRIDQKSTIIFTEPTTDRRSVLELLQGVLHIFSHRPRSLKVVTPYVNGSVEGTEFLVRVDNESTIISVFEGLVAASNDKGQINISSGQSIKATKNTPPSPLVIVRPRDAVAWTLYYPLIIDLSQADYQDETAKELSQIASDLSVGRIDNARGSLGEILKREPNNSEALALFSIIETVSNHKDKALELALQAVENDPKSAAAGLALSYAYQAQFNIPATLAILQQTTELAPGNGMVKARLAEILLATGDIDKSLDSAKDAVSLNPNLGLPQSILGFVHLSRIETEAAQAAFTKAIELDPAFPLARLGLGLAKIRDGQLEEGRADIEIAAALDPGNALIRSYLGKAYYEEKRDSLARRQYDIAKELDPADPTPWYYDAIRKQTINRPVEALHDLQRSIALNDNRAVYRSSLLLDDDLASRSAGLGRIYTDLGFQQLARVEGLKSVQTNPGNYSAHRFLADTYSSMPHHEIARVSELLQAQLLQPINISPVQPQLAESASLLQTSNGPTAASTSEFNPLFLRDKVSLQINGIAGNNSTFGEEIVLSGVEGRISYSLGQLHYETDGIRENNDQEQDIYNAFIQGAITPSTSLMAEIRYKDRDQGDITHLFDQSDYSSSLRQSEETKSARIGLRHDLKPNSTIIGTAIISSDDGSAATGGSGYFYSVDISNEADNVMVEAQHIYQGGRFSLQTGAGYMNADDNTAINYTAPFQYYFAEDSRTEHANIYSYAQIDLPHNFVATAGLSGDILDSPVKDREDLNPKLGLTWQPTESTILRAAAFRAVTRRLIYAQTIEPTSVAGFNQFFSDYNEASASWTYGLGIDHSFSADLHAGLQFYQRNLDWYFDNTSQPGGLQEEDELQENIGSAYIYWTPFNWMAAGLEYYYDHNSTERYGNSQQSFELTTHQLAPKLQFFHNSGLAAGITANFVDQEGKFGHDIFEGYTEDSDEFWLVDLYMSYRLPKRYGILKLQVNNLLDEEFNYVDIDPLNPRFLQGQQIVCSLTVVF